MMSSAVGASVIVNKEMVKVTAVRMEVQSKRSRGQRAAAKARRP